MNIQQGKTLYFTKKKFFNLSLSTCLFALLQMVLFLIPQATFADLSPGDLVVVMEEAVFPASPSQILKVDPITGQQTAIASLDGYDGEPGGLTIDNSGMIYITVDPLPSENDPRGKILKVNPASGEVTLFSAGGLLTDPNDIALDPNGNLIVAQPGTILRVNKTNGEQSIVSSYSNLVEPEGLSVTAEGVIYVADNPTERVLRITTDGMQEVFFNRTIPVGGPYDTVVAADNSIAILQYGNVVSVDQTTKTQKIIAGDQYIGDNILRTVGFRSRLDVEADGDIVISFDNFTDSGIARVDNASGNVSIVTISPENFRGFTGISVVKELNPPDTGNGTALEPPTLSYTIDGVNLSVSWTPASGAAGYTFYYAPFPYTGPESIAEIDMGTQTTLSADLWEGASFLVAVQSYNDQNVSNYSNIETIAIPYTTAPESPELSINLDGTNLSATWGSVPGATGYRLYYTLSAYTGHEAFQPLDVGNQSSFSYQGLPEEQTYSIAVVAYNEFGESDFSNVAQFTVDVAPPSTPSIVGKWQIDEYTGPNTCGEPQGDYWGNATVTIQANGQFTLYGETYYGTINGNTISATTNINYPEQGGTGTVTFASLTVSTDGYSVEGYDEWSWTNGYLSCSGKNYYYGDRIE